MNKLKPIYASAYSSVVAIVTVVGLTIGAELSVPLKTWIAGFTGHHWVTKSWISIIVFVLFFVIFQFSNKSVTESQTKTVLTMLQIFIVLGFLAILGFYIYEFF